MIMDSEKNSKFSNLMPGLSGSMSVIVTEAHTARYLGSGHRQVLGTPALVALMEAAAQKAVDHLLPENHQTVGTHLEIHHDAATPVNMKVTISACLLSVNGRILSFGIEAHDEMECIAKATHSRAIATTASLDRLLKKKIKNT